MKNKKNMVYVDFGKWNDEIRETNGLIRNDTIVKLDIESLMMGSIEENVQATLDRRCKDDGGIQFEGIIAITTPYLKEEEIDLTTTRIPCNDMCTDVTWLYKPTMAN